MSYRRLNTVLLGLLLPILLLAQESRSQRTGVRSLARLSEIRMTSQAQAERSVAVLRMTGTAQGVHAGAQEKMPTQKVEEKKAPDYSKEAFLVEQWHTRVRFENDGTSRQETLLRAKVQSDAGVQQLGELNLGYNSANQKLQIEYVRVRKADGSVVSAGPEAVQDLSAPVTREAPTYTDYRVKHISVPALRPGETLEYKTVTLTETPLAPGHFWLEYDFEKNAIVMDEQLEVNVPKRRAIKLKTHPDAKPDIIDEGERKIYHWKSSNTERPSEEELKERRKKKRQQEPEGPAVQLTTFQNWEEVGRWYAGLEKERIAPTAEIRAKAEKLIAGRANELEKIEALYDFVAKNHRYVSLSFGLGRYQPHAAAEVMANQYGDCKDKHTLLAALLEAVGIRAEAVLIGSQRKLDPEMPSPSQFDHVITGIPASKEYIWLDTTTEVAPFRLLSANLREKKTLVISRENGARLEETPANPPFATTQVVEINGEVSDLGKLKARVRYILRGDAELALRAAFRRMPQHQWKQLAQWAAVSDGYRGEVTEVKVSEPAATKEPFQFEYELTQANFLDWSKKKSEMTLPLPTMGLPSIAEDEDLQENIELGTPLEATTRLALTLPANFAARAPVAIRVTRDYAEYQSSYKMEQNTLRAERVLKFRMRELPAERAGDLRTFLRAVRNDEGQSLWVESTIAGTPTILETAKAEELYEAGAAALSGGNFDAAVELLQRVTQLEPKHKGAWNNLGRAYMGRLQFDAAIAAFRKQIEVNPYDEHVYNNLGLALWRQQKLEEAEGAFKKQIAAHPLDKFAHGNLGMLYREKKQYAAAIEELEKAVTLTPNNAALHVNLGQCYLNLDQQGKALEAFDKAVELAPSPTTWNNVAYELSLKKVHLERAQQYAESAVASVAAVLRNVQLERITMNEMALVAGIAAYWDTLGWVHFQQGNLEKAERYVRAAWLVDFHGEVGDHLGQILEKTGRKTEAIQVYAQALNATRPVEETRERLAALAGGAQEAAELKKNAFDGPSKVRTVKLGKLVKEKASADFLIVFAPAAAGSGAQVEEVKFIRGSETLRPMTEALKKAKYEVLFPDDTPTKLIRRGMLNCLPESVCVFVLLTADSVASVR